MKKLPIKKDNGILKNERFKFYDLIQRGGCQIIYEKSYFPSRFIVDWYCGLADDYLFGQIIDEDTMNNELEAVWDKYITPLPKNKFKTAELSFGWMSGYCVHVPFQMAEEIYQIVYNHYFYALHKLIEFGIHKSPLLHEERHAILEKITMYKQDRENRVRHLQQRGQDNE
jgi:hypothetical protein